MPHFEITSRSVERFSVRVADCQWEHARSVFDQLLVEPTCPSDLEMREVACDGSPVRRTLIDRLLRRWHRG